MTSDRKRAANIRNSASSTGPRSRAGKAVSRFNALQHGLAAPLAHLPDAQQQVSSLMAAIAEDLPLNAETRGYAQAFAEATVQLNRIAEVKALMIQNAQEAAAEFRALALEGRDIDVVEPLRDTLYELQRIGRYEQRALSSRHKALKLLAARCLRHAKP